MGLVPGLGYAYAGEYANAMRTLMLNNLLIWGIVVAGGSGARWLPFEKSRYTQAVVTAALMPSTAATGGGRTRTACRYRWESQDMNSEGEKTKTI